MIGINRRAAFVRKIFNRLQSVAESNTLGIDYAITLL